ncbi:AAA family ATPase [Vicingus serpentipes]|uniref:AAA family ATPase n=1 Tax=Vicingus serpentipes TaxID=1926625 RepID=A0A5C6RWB0_9FLAO|nr:ATP-binding protein [Vicingus serpentipes]TXB66149.1 AAA family ATPase [Vicingus serpentipes]
MGKEKINMPETMIDQIETIANLFTKVEDSDTTEDILSGRKEFDIVNHLSLVLNLSITETILFSVLMHLQMRDNYQSTIVKISDFICYPVVELYKKYKHFESLKRKGFIEIKENRGEDRIIVRKKVFKQIIRMEIPHQIDDDITIVNLMQNLYQLIEGNRFDQTKDEFSEEIKANLESSNEIKELNLLKSMGLKWEEIVVFLFVAYSSIIEDRSANVHYAGRAVYENLNRFVSFKRSLLHGKNILLRKKLLKLEGGVFMDNEFYLLGEVGAKIMSVTLTKTLAKVFKTDVGEIINPESISKVDLFYNSRELNEVNNLKKVLRESNYKKCITRLKSKKLQEGITVMLYGAPGTGKTELVYQLSRITGRKILMVDLSSVRDKYVGESEKRVAKVFDDYVRLSKIESRTPILLLNESDALISKRINVKASVDQMNNSMQNVFLQKMEEFKGIMIATSNLIGNIDKAFERRFLIKLKIDKPEQHNRFKILHHHFPELSKKQKEELSFNYDLTGAQIGNVSRRYTIDGIFNSNQDESRIEELIKQELMKSKVTKSKRKIGYLN